MTFCFWTYFLFGQKFMIQNNDTIPFKLEKEVREGDTIYLGACQTFEIIKGEIGRISLA